MTLAVGNDAVLNKQPSGPSSGIGAANSTVKGLSLSIRWGEGIYTLSSVVAVPRK
jgi:hypothetical protein